MKKWKKDLIEAALVVSLTFGAVACSREIFGVNAAPVQPTTEAVTETASETDARVSELIEDAQPLPRAAEALKRIAERAEMNRETEFSSVVETEAEEPTEAESLYNVPLSEDLQLFIINLCEEKHIEPALVFAVIAKESGYNAAACGDNGNSHGLMQIQPRWNRDVMDRLGCADLFDPYQNVTVGIEILSEKLSKYGDVGKALTAYNAGDGGAWNYYFSQGVTASPYAQTVMAYAKNIS